MHFLSQPLGVQCASVMDNFDLVLRNKTGCLTAVPPQL
jgi:hypothetical protein